MIKNNYFKKITGVLLFCVLSMSVSFAAVDRVMMGINGSQLIKLIPPLTMSPSLIIQDQKYPITFLTLPELKKGQNIVTLRYDDSKRTTDTYWDLEVTYTIKIYNVNGSVVNTYVGEKLKITYNSATSYKDKDVIVYDGGFKAELFITNIAYSNNGGASVATVPSIRDNDVYLELEQRTERYSSIDDPAPNIIAGTVTSTNELPISWTYKKGAESYDLEWLFIDAGTSAFTSDYNYDFANATRINTSNQFYNIPLAYPRGILLFRVRGVGVDINATPAFVTPAYSFWSVLNSSPTGTTLGIPFSSVDYRYDWNGLETDYNWQYSANYAEDGKRKEIISFYDGSMHGRQTATILNSDNNVVLAETKYDFEGRPAVQMLATPLQNSGIKYYSNFNPAFEKMDFDVTTNFDDPDPVGTTDETGKYYSPSNTLVNSTNSYVPDAEGYPYSRTLYMQDGTNRISSQSGVGINHKIGSGHETKYYYGGPLQPELDRIFGCEAGFFKHYKKNMVRDANGQLSISYLDQAGRVVASALAGDKPSNLLDLEYINSPQTITADLLYGNNFVSGDSKISESTITVSNPGTYTFEYSLGTAVDFCGEVTCGTDCPTCKYDLLIEVRDEMNEPMPLTLTFGSPCTISSPTAYILCEDLSAGSYSFTANFINVGTYTISKTVKIHYPTTQTLIDRFDDCITAPYIEPEACETCQSICENTYPLIVDGSTSYYLDLDGTHLSVPDGLEKIAACKAYCEGSAPIVDECAMKRRMLLNDVSPGGQYFDNTFGGANYKYDWLIDKVLDPTLSVPAFTSWCLSNFGVDHMEDWDDVRNNWDESWAEVLVNYHPEICAWNYFCNSQVCGDDQTLQMTAVNDYGTKMTWDDANNYFNPLYIAQDATMPGGTMSDICTLRTNTSYSDYNPYPQNTTYNDEYFTKDCLDDLTFDCTTTNVDPQLKMLDYIKNYQVLYTNGSTDVFANIYYFINDPDDIIGTTSVATTICGFTINPAALDLLKALHGDPTATQGTPASKGLFGGTNPVSTPYEYFKSAYLFMRNLIIYKGFDSYCTNELIADTPSDLMFYSTTLNTHSTRFQIRYPKNEIFETILGVCEPFDPASLNTAFSTLASNTNPAIVENCETACAGKADYWVSKIQETCTLTTAQASEIGSYLEYICSHSCGIETPEGLSEIPEPGVSFGGFSQTGPFNTFAEVLTAYSCSPTAIVHPTPDPSAGACSCENLTNYIESLSPPLDPYNPTDYAAIAAEMNSDFPQSPLPDYTAATIHSWMSACSTRPNSDAAVETGGVLHNLPSTLICAPKAWALCSCENLIAYAGANGFDIIDYSGIADALNDDFNPDVDYTSTQVQAWMSACESPANTDMLSTGDLYDMPPSMKCPDPAAPVPTACDIAQAQAIADALYNQALNLSQSMGSTIQTYLAGYKNYCLSSLDTREDFTVSYEINEYDYTLYYYDQAGNLIKTVPPNGVHLLSSTSTPTLNNIMDYRTGTSTVFNVPAHTMVTNYKYNSLQQLTEQTTPDAGKTEFWYDELGRMVVSQNSRQQLTADYSYTVYDELSRISQVGEIRSTATAMTDIISRDVASLYSWISSTSNPRTQITRTIYDDAVSSTVNGYFGSGGQENLRNRVSTTMVMNTSFTGNPATDAVTTYDNATHYSYDIHGNVKTLIQENKSLASVNTNFKYDLKHVDYEYDLVSGNVNQVSFQDRVDGSSKPFMDRFYHRYYYDADNRITEAETSFDKIIWQKEAKYFYLPTGPLARVEIGDKQVQATDYAYTIQGWVKGINSNTLVASRDIGKDGLPLLPGTSTKNNNANFAYDAMGYSLGYFADDYKSIHTYATTDKFEAVTGSTFITEAPSLYNGNISHMVNSFLDINQTQVEVFGKAFQYDQLNRIRQALSFTSSSVVSSNSFSSATALSKYDEVFNYDLNGNILLANRNGNNSGSLTMDDLTYNYYNSTGSSTYALYSLTPVVTPIAPAGASNKLAYVSDGTADGTYAGDFDGNTSATNFGYDLTGNLIRDDKEKIASITWNVYGKIRSITRTSGTTDRSDLEFQYDGAGNRICKIEKPRPSGSVSTQPSWIYTYYVRDASGNVLATYNKEYKSLGSNQYDVEYNLSEMHLFGSSRLGLFNNTLSAQVALPASEFTATVSSGLLSVSSSYAPHTYTHTTNHHERYLGYKQFELSNHLGNVIGVVSDRKLGVDNTSDLVSDYYLPDVISSGDYYSFGAPMPGRGVVSSTSYPYGFGGQMQDKEISGEGNSYTAEFWQYDPRLGRRWNIDPVDQVSVSNYAAFANNPILLNDPKGDTPGGDEKKAKSAPECAGDGCKTITSPIGGNTGGYSVSIPSNSTTFSQTQTFSVAGKPDNSINVTTGFGYYEGDIFNYYSWSSEMNGYYNYSTNTVYGGNGVAAAEGYMNSVYGTQLGSSSHPGYSSGATVGGIQNGINTVGAIAGVAQLGYVGARWAVGKYATNRLGGHLAYAMENYALSEKQTLAIGLQPNSANRYIGTQIDELFKLRVGGDPWLKPILSTTPRFKFGPDAYNKTFNLWWDVTTKAQWNAHTKKYTVGFGEGIPLLWKK
jgi:RHS repeat-associated protein